MAVAILLATLGPDCQQSRGMAMQSLSLYPTATPRAELEVCTQISKNDSRRCDGPEEWLPVKT